MNNDQDLQNRYENTAVLLVVLHKKPPVLSISEITLTDFLEIVPKPPRVFCAIGYKIYEIIFTQYTYIDF